MAGNLAVASINGYKVNHLTTGVRQTVQNSVVDANGYPVFATIGTGLSVNIAATAVPIIVHSAGGKIIDDVIAVISADTTLAVVTNTTNYGYVDTDMTTGVVTLGNTVLAPVYQFGGTPSIVAGQHTYNIAEMKMYVGNGSVATQVKRTFILEAVTGASTVTSVVNYALNGIYESAYSAVTFGTNSNYNTNIGTTKDYQYITDILKCTIAEIGYSIGDLVYNPHSSQATGNYGQVANISSNNTSSVLIGTGGPLILNKSTFASSSITAADWNKKIIVQRGW